MSKIKKPVVFIVVIVVAIIACAGTIGGLIYYFNNKITYQINDTLPDGDGKMARVIILGGQSNASGCSLDEYLKQNVSPQKYAEYQNGYDNVYINYLSGKNMSEGFVKCATLQGELDGAFGPELGLAEKLHQMYPDELFFIVKCAWGGTNLYEQWLSPSSFGKTGKLYKHFIAFVSQSIKYLKSKDYDIKIEGMCWMQGESDSFSVDTATNYEVNLLNFIKDIRSEFSKYSSNDGIAFVDATIAPNSVFWVYHELVNQSKINVSQKSPINALIDTNKEALDCSKEPMPNPDIPHYDSLSQIKLGHLFAEKVSQFFD